MPIETWLNQEGAVVYGMQGNNLGFLATGPLAIAMRGAAVALITVAANSFDSVKYLARFRVFLNGTLVAFAVAFYVQAQFEESQIQYIVQSVTTEKMTTEQKVMALLREANAMVRFGLRNAGSSAPLIQRLPLRSFDEAMLAAHGCMR